MFPETIDNHEFPFLGMDISKDSSRLGFSRSGASLYEVVLMDNRVGDYPFSNSSGLYTLLNCRWVPLIEVWRDGGTYGWFLQLELSGPGGI